MKYVLSFVIRQGKVFAPKHASVSWHCKGEVFSWEDESGIGNSPYPRILDFLPPCWSCLRWTNVILCRELGWELKRSMELLLLLLLLLRHFSRVRLCETPWMAAHQAPPSLGFSRQEHWSGLPFPSPMHESEKWKVKVKSLSHVRLPATPWTAAYQAPQSMESSRQEYWSGVLLPSPSMELAGF